MNTAHIFDFKMRQPRRNLPAKASRKRGEANFVSAFSKAYIESVASKGVGGLEFPLAGFGIADFVWVAWCPNGRDGSALSLERLKAVLLKHRLTAFEMKLTHWRKGLTQHMVREHVCSDHVRVEDVISRLGSGRGDQQVDARRPLIEQRDFVQELEQLPAVTVHGLAAGVLQGGPEGI